MYNHKPTFREWFLFSAFAPIENKVVRNSLTAIASIYCLYSFVKAVNQTNATPRVVFSDEETSLLRRLDPILQVKFIVSELGCTLAEAQKYRKQLGLLK